MKERIFWDTWAFVALADSRERGHHEARAIRRQLFDEDHKLVTTEAVLTELGNHFSDSYLRNYALGQLEVVQHLVKSNAGTVFRVTEDIYGRAWELYRNRPDKDWGHTDCISFVVMSELGLTTAFTADEHFEQAGFTRLVKI